MNKNVGAFLMDSCMLLKIYFVQGLRYIQGKGRGRGKGFSSASSFQYLSYWKQFGIFLVIWKI